MMLKLTPTTNIQTNISRIPKAGDNTGGRVSPTIIVGNSISAMSNATPAMAKM